MTDHEHQTIAGILADALCLATASLGPANKAFQLACQVRDELGGHGYVEGLEVVRYVQKMVQGE